MWIKSKYVKSEMWGSDGSKDDNAILLGCNAM
jgi:hypothetical protein